MGLKTKFRRALGRNFDLRVAQDKVKDITVKIGAATYILMIKAGSHRNAGSSRHCSSDGGVFFEGYSMEECLIDEEKKKRWKDIGYVLVLYKNSSVRKYGVKTTVWIKLLMGSHSVKYHWVPVSKIFSWGPTQ